MDRFWALFLFMNTLLAQSDSSSSVRSTSDSPRYHVSYPHTISPSSNKVCLVFTDGFLAQDLNLKVSFLSPTAETSVTQKNADKYNIKIIQSPNGYILSPNFPEPYPEEENCAWIFTTTPGHRIKLKFEEFELENSTDCAYDQIVLHDGPTFYNDTLGRFCGSDLPHPVLTSSDKMYMVFKSDGSKQNKGFKAFHTTVCGGRLMATPSVKHLNSHFKYGDSNYDKKEDCDWVIEAEKNYRVRVRFLTFEIEAGNGCSYDYVEIFDGYNASSNLLGRFCGKNLPPEFLSSSESLLIRFHSDDYLQKKGFAIEYSCYGCQ